jgi:hypothetical protein
MDRDESQSNDEGTVVPGDDGIAFAGIQNPSDALGILAQVADHDTQEPGMRGGVSLQARLSHGSPQVDASPSAFRSLGDAAGFMPLPQADSIPYQLCSDGVLTSWKIRELIAR